MNQHIEIKKINESYFYIRTTDNNLKMAIMKLLTVVDESSKFKPKFKKYGMGLDEHKFYRIVEDVLVIPTGLEFLLHQFNISLPKLDPEFTEQDIKVYLEETLKILPFPPYEHQLNIFKDAVLNHGTCGRAATGCGKSLAISLIADFLYKNKKKILILVPSISLITQIKSDILSYNLTELHDIVHLIGGEYQEKHFDAPVTIGTWQSIMKMGDALPEIDAIIIDEFHGAKADTNMLEIGLKTKNAKYRIGLTGTLPEAQHDKMSLFSIAGKPKTYMTTAGLVKLGMATPLRVNVLKLEYNEYDKRTFRSIGSNYAQQLSFIKEHETRNQLVGKLATNISEKTGNTIILTSHIQHGIDIFLEIFKIRNPGVEVEQKNIVGKKAFEFQKQFQIYFINGATEASQREEIRRVMDVNETIKITLEDDSMIEINETEIVTLSNGTQKLALNLSEDDEIDDNFINTFNNRSKG